MKVFISWSGDRSNKIAEVLKQWIKHVIQTVEPFVSSQDVSKGARWSTDIAKELQDTNFGILCVTKDNYQQPWLLFEAGALSKTIEKSYVVPLLFDLGPSDLQDSPLLQFQATSNSKEEIKKLIITINSACEATSLDSREIDEAFEVWYPKLVENLSKIEPSADEPVKNETQSAAVKTTQILEELLELTRINQKLLRNPENKSSEEIKNLSVQISSILRRMEESELVKISARRLFFPQIEEFLMFSQKRGLSMKFSVLFVLSPYKDALPWLYDSASELMDILKLKKNQTEKEDLIHEFINFVEYSVRYSCKYDLSEVSMEYMQSIRELPTILNRIMVNYI